MKAISTIESVSSNFLSKKELGAYYTPHELTDILSSWAIQTVKDRVLEPSFGGCGFLKSASQRLSSLGAKHPQRQLYGCDIDSKAFDHLHDTFHEVVDLHHFKLANFLSLSVVDWPAFDAVIGNPPYLSYHKVPKDLRKKAIGKLEDLSLDIDLRSGMWAYFVLLSFQYLSSGGRMAWVLPGSFLHSNYSRSVRRQIMSRFKRVQAFNIQQRLFLSDDTDEQTVILLADGFSEDTLEQSDIPLEFCKDLKDLDEKVAEWECGKVSKWSCDDFHERILSGASESPLTRLERSPETACLADFFDVRIGLVAGDKKFLVLSREKAIVQKISLDALMPVISTFRQIEGLEYTHGDYDRDLEGGEDSLMVSPWNLEDADKTLLRYLSSYPKDKIKSVATFRKRTPWCRLDDGNIPDAFLPVINHNGPRLVLNRQGINCTNTLYRVYFKKRLSLSTRKLVAISLLTTFSQISAERKGRISGSGALKHEPREVEKIKVLIPQNVSSGKINRAFRKIDKLVRSGRENLARKAANAFIFGESSLELEDQEAKILEDALNEIRVYRKSRLK